MRMSVEKAHREGRQLLWVTKQKYRTVEYIHQL